MSSSNQHDEDIAYLMSLGNVTVEEALEALANANGNVEQARIRLYDDDNDRDAIAEKERQYHLEKHEKKHAKSDNFQTAQPVVPRRSGRKKRGMYFMFNFVLALLFGIVFCGI